MQSLPCFDPALQLGQIRAVTAEWQLAPSPQRCVTPTEGPYWPLVPPNVLCSWPWVGATGVTQCVLNFGKLDGLSTGGGCT